MRDSLLGVRRAAPTLNQDNSQVLENMEGATTARTSELVIPGANG